MRIRSLVEVHFTHAHNCKLKSRISQFGGLFFQFCSSILNIVVLDVLAVSEEKYIPFHVKSKSIIRYNKESIFVFCSC